MTRSWLCTLALLGVASPAAAQLTGGRAGAGFTWETIRFSDAERIDIETLTLLSAPFAATIPFSRAVELSVSGAWARGELSRPTGEASSVSGLTDTEIALRAMVGRDVLTITAIAQLPTGVSELTAPEADAAGMFAADVLPFRITNWGAGGGFGLSTAVARPVGDFAFGIAVGYVVAQEFEPVAEQSFKYRPGNQLHVRAAIDRTFGTSGKGALTVTWQSFGDDQSDGDNLFRSGDRLQSVASYAFAAGPQGSGIVYAGYLRRAKGEFLRETELEPAKNLAFGGIGLRLPAGRTVFQPAADLRVQGGDEGAGSGYTVGIGGSVDLPIGAARLVPTLRGRFGSVELSSGLDSGFTGAELAVALRF